MNLYLKKLPGISNIIKAFNHKIQTYGWQEGLRNITKHLDTKIEVYGISEETSDILQNKPIILIGNHPFESEVLVIPASLPPRDNIKMIGNAKLLGICECVDELIIPVYIHHRTKKNTPRSVLGFINNRLRPHQLMDPPTEIALTKKSITQAAEHVSNQQLVMIFPGRHSRNGIWFPGVGHLISQIINHFHFTDFYVGFVYVANSNPRDYLRILPAVRKLFPPFKVYFHKPICASEIIADEPKEIVNELQTIYENWITTI